MIGKVINNRYRLDEKIGEGGMGVVYKAWDTVLERTVAVKMLHPLHSGDKIFLSRFRVEARAAAQLMHPNIVHVIDFLETELGICIVMEYVTGVTLAEKILQAGPLRDEQILPILRQILAAISHAHERGVIHRDMKPSNVMLTPQGGVKVMDFGLAKTQQGVSLTGSGETAGTLAYMPPEQVHGLAKADKLSDIYSIGMTCYEMLAGRLPFDKNENFVVVGRKIDEGKFLPPDRYNLAAPKDLSKIVMKATAKNPAQRFQSADEMLEAITQLEVGRVPTLVLPQSRPHGVKKTRAAAITLACALVLLVLVLLLSPALRQSRPDLVATPGATASSESTASDSPAIFPKADTIKPVERNVSEDSIKKAETQKVQQPVNNEEDFVSGTTEGQVEPSSLFGKLQILAKPYGSISIDDTLRIKDTDIEYTAALAIGIHRLEVTHPKFGKWRKSVEVKAGAPSQVHIDFTKQVAVTVASVPVWAEIYIDGQPIGQQTTSRLALRVGLHTIEVRREGYILEGGAREINLEDHLEEPLVFTLRKTP